MISSKSRWTLGLLSFLIANSVYAESIILTSKINNCVPRVAMGRKPRISEASSAFDKGISLNRESKDRKSILRLIGNYGLNLVSDSMYGIDTYTRKSQSIITIDLDVLNTEGKLRMPIRVCDNKAGIRLQEQNKKILQQYGLTVSQMAETNDVYLVSSKNQSNSRTEASTQSSELSNSPKQLFNSTNSVPPVIASSNSTSETGTK